MGKAVLSAIFAIIPLLACAQGITRAELWAAARTPAPGPARIVGGAGLGCIAGAERLPDEGLGWMNVRVSRNRHWGHPALVTWIGDFAGRARAAGFADLWIGDMGQPRGGPMPYGHASHQAGVDVDIWLDLSPKPVVPAAQRERIDVASLVLPGGAAVDPARFTPAHAALIRLAAERPGVDRIFVHYAIKQALCRSHGGEAWLRRVRPWWGHDSHMHVRLRCPPGQRECRDIAPPPGGDGCDASLAWWFSPEAHTPSRRAPGPRPQLPAACAGVLSAR